MIDFDKIPKLTYHQLVKLIGKEAAEKYIEKEKYNFGAVTNKILFLQLRNFIKKKPKLFLVIILLIVILLVYYLLDLFLII